MKFDIKDIKSWSNRHDVKTLSVTGFFGNSLSEIDDEIKRYNNGDKDRLHELYMISDNGCYCFGYALYFADTGTFGGTNNFAFFLPVDAVKADEPKEKKYRPIKSLVELSIAIYGELNHFKTVCMGNDLFIRLKGCKNYERVLITHLEFDSNHALVAINGNTLENLFKNYELRNDKGEYVPFGVEVEDEY